MLGVVIDEGEEEVEAGAASGEFPETDPPRDAFGGSEYSRSFLDYFSKFKSTCNLWVTVWKPNWLLVFHSSYLTVTHVSPLFHARALGSGFLGTRTIVRDWNPDLNWTLRPRWVAASPHTPGLGCPRVPGLYSTLCHAHSRGHGKESF